MVRDPKRSDEKQPTPAEREAERRRRIAVEAYYNAERRGFEEGREIDDWLEAERRVDSRASEEGQRGEAAARQPDGEDAARLEAGEAGALAGQTGSPAAERIAPDQVTKWARELNVSAPRLREAIKRVGPVVRDVKKYLESAPPPA